MRVMVKSQSNLERRERIKLRIKTSNGINLICTCARGWLVSEFLPYIERAYNQVIDQSSAPIRVLWITKEEFYVAGSQIVGDVFNNNEEVFCKVAEGTKRQKKKKKREQKSNKMYQKEEQNQLEDQ